MPAPLHRRTTVRRGGFTSPDGAEAALRTFLEGEAGGFNADPNQTVAGYLNTWLAAKAPALKPTTMARYRDYVHNDLVPAFGSLRLDDLRHRHISAFVTGRLAVGRGRTTLYRCSSALGRRPPGRVRSLRAVHALRDRHQPPRDHRTQDPLQQELGGHLTPRRVRSPTPGPRHRPHPQMPRRSVRRTRPLPTRRPAAATALRPRDGSGNCPTKPTFPE
ncbi:N-terminal phage integrase SAM-like domain-containing protein [Streptomyces sasae]|uniref:N-terminal phage integrase SAM-like domain-containing protein n=1 Tax=Streptomyces sasae TaxID=1266772 RepID=UPI00292D2DC0|nr:N-terminal phage integrase SAM-like domain-containing protein [Streptomyces sasae]